MYLLFIINTYLLILNKENKIIIYIQCSATPHIQDIYIMCTRFRYII
jgi:hypothetical protein